MFTKPTAAPATGHAAVAKYCENDPSARTVHAIPRVSGLPATK